VRRYQDHPQIMTFKHTYDLTDVKEIELPSFTEASGLLTIMESSKLPLQIERTFTIHGTAGALRGRHAHRQCGQILICLTNSCRVSCDDGRARKQFCLDNPAKGLYVPPSIWTDQTYDEAAILLVLCDRPYEPEDYIREYDEFLRYRKEHF